jgi:hypothetical protein
MLSTPKRNSHCKLTRQHRTGLEVAQVQLRGEALLTEQAPIAWQQSGNVRLPIVVRRDMAIDGTVYFALGELQPRTAPG